MTTYSACELLLKELINVGCSHLVSCQSFYMTNCMVCLILHMPIPVFLHSIHPWLVFNTFFLPEAFYFVWHPLPNIRLARNVKIYSLFILFLVRATAECYTVLDTNLGIYFLVLLSSLWQPHLNIILIPLSFLWQPLLNITLARKLQIYCFHYFLYPVRALSTHTG